MGQHEVGKFKIIEEENYYDGFLNGVVESETGETFAADIESTSFNNRLRAFRLDNGNYIFEDQLYYFDKEERS